MEVSGELNASAALSTGKNPRYPFYGNLMGYTANRDAVVVGGGEDKCITPGGNRTPILQSVIQTVV
jgi:hypothetical protein